MSSGSIDSMVRSWREELPDLDADAMASFALVHRLSALVRKEVDVLMSDHGLSTGEFDVLSALRRAGKPFEMRPAEIASAVMLSPSGMTHRLDLLETAGLIERLVDPSNRRTAPARLSKAGQKLVETLVRSHAELLTGLLGEIKPAERRQLDLLLSKISTTVFETAHSRTQTILRSPTTAPELSSAKCA